MIRINAFWTSWKRRTPVEDRACASIIKALRRLFHTVPPSAIVAVYVKGSFVRREMREKSDVDIVPLVNNNATKKKILGLDQQLGERYRPSQLLPRSLHELRKKPDVFIERLHEHRLVWGTPLAETSFPRRSDLARLRGLHKAFRTAFLPNYRARTFGFGELVKQVFWLTDLEERVRGRNPPPIWKKLAHSVRDSRHIVHDALTFRQHPPKERRKRRAFVRKLERHLAHLERLMRGH